MLVMEQFGNFNLYMQSDVTKSFKLYIIFILMDIVDQICVKDICIILHFVASLEFGDMLVFARQEG